MPPVCKVCASPKKKEIDAALLDGVSSLRDISAKFGIAVQTLHRHRVNHQGWVPASDIYERNAREDKKRAQMAAESRVAYLESKLPTREALGQTLEDVVARLDAIVAKHEVDGGTDAIALKGLGEMRATVAELSRLAGHVGGGSTQNINVGVQVNMSAAEIGAAMAKHLGTVAPGQALEVLELAADE